VANKKKKKVMINLPLDARKSISAAKISPKKTRQMQKCCLVFFLLLLFFIATGILIYFFGEFYFLYIPKNLI
jgi:hypothetical protein